MPSDSPSAASAPIARHFAVWALRLPLALLFVYAGAVKFPSAPGAMWVRIFAEIGWGQWFRYATGAIEVAGGILLLVPKATVIAVPLLACTMVGAIVVHLTVVGLGPATVAVLILLAALSGVWRLSRR